MMVLAVAAEEAKVEVEEEEQALVSVREAEKALMLRKEGALTVLKPRKEVPTQKSRGERQTRKKKEL